MSKVKYKFNKEFLYGGSMSAVQSDGMGMFRSAKTNYELLYEKKPEKFFNNIGPNITSDFIKNYKSDLKLFKEIGIKALRHSFSWAKLFPDGDDQKPAQVMVDYYHQLFNEMRLNNIHIFMSLMHFELPEFIVKKGGLIAPTFSDDFSRFAQFIFSEYKDEVEYFATFNEPFVQCSSMYLSDGENGMWPLENSIEKYVTALNNVIISNAMINQLAKKFEINQKVGIVIDFNPGYVRNPDNINDQQALIDYTSFREGSYLDPVLLGVYSQRFTQILSKMGLINLIPNQSQLQLLKDNPSQWLGVNYYTPMGIQSPIEKTCQSFQSFFQQWDNPIALMNKSRGWEIKPSALYDVLMRIKNDYHNVKTFITENGIAIENESDYEFDGKINDDYRIKFFKLHLAAVWKAINQGANVHGFLMWTPIDSWSFMNAYKNRYGLIALDLEKQKRTIKKSGYWWKEVSEKGEFEDE